jgi:hypothetical protein
MKKTKSKTNVKSVEFKSYLLIITLFSIFSSSAQNSLEKINIESYTNYGDSYNYTYWDHNWLTNLSENRSFSNQTDDYALNIDFKDLAINSLLITDTSNTLQPDLML